MHRLDSYIYVSTDSVEMFTGLFKTAALFRLKTCMYDVCFPVVFMFGCESFDNKNIQLG